MENISIAQSEMHLLNEMVKVMVEATAPEKIILFGSRVKGTAKENSDYDFLIVEIEPFRESGSRRKEIGKLNKALARFNVPTDILIYSPEEIEQRRHWQNGIILDVLGQGQILYERT